MAYLVQITKRAAHDIEDIYNYIAENDSTAAAEHVLDQFDTAIKSLQEFPERGSFPAELLAAGKRNYRQISFKPYRFIYRIMGMKVEIVVVVDGRRDLRTLLAKRQLLSKSE
jgi:toxin ParE1/3/4